MITSLVAKRSAADPSENSARSFNGAQQTLDWSARRTAFVPRCANEESKEDATNARNYGNGTFQSSHRTGLDIFVLETREISITFFGRSIYHLQ